MELLLSYICSVPSSQLAAILVSILSLQTEEGAAGQLTFHTHSLLLMSQTRTCSSCEAVTSSRSEQEYTSFICAPCRRDVITSVGLFKSIIRTRLSPAPPLARSLSVRNASALTVPTFE